MSIDHPSTLPDQKDIQEVKKLSPEHAAKLLFFSFQFSQGNANLQEAIFHWLHLHYPEYKISDEAIKDIHHKASTQAEKMIIKHEGIHTDTAASQNTTSPIDENIVSAVTSDQLQTFSKIINSEGDKYTDEKTLNVLLAGIIDQDYLFLITKQGRPRRTDRFMSHLCHYGLKGASTGVEEYNKLFKQIKGLATATTQPGMILKKEYTDRLRQVIAIHNEHCPDDLVTLDVPA